MLFHCFFGQPFPLTYFDNLFSTISLSTLCSRFKSAYICLSFSVLVFKFFQLLQLRDIQPTVFGFPLVKSALPESVLRHSSATRTPGHLIPGMQEVAARVMDEVVTPVMLDLSMRYPQESQIAELPQNGGDRQHDS